MKVARALENWSKRFSFQARRLNSAYGEEISRPKRNARLKPAAKPKQGRSCFTFSGMEANYDRTSQSANETCPFETTDSRILLTEHLRHARTSRNRICRQHKNRREPVRQWEFDLLRS